MVSFQFSRRILLRARHVCRFGEIARTLQRLGAVMGCHHLLSICIKAVVGWKRFDLGPPQTWRLPTADWAAPFTSRLGASSRGRMRRPAGRDGRLSRTPYGDCFHRRMRPLNEDSILRAGFHSSSRNRPLHKARRFLFGPCRPMPLASAQSDRPDALHAAKGLSPDEVGADSPDFRRPCSPASAISGSAVWTFCLSTCCRARTAW